MAFAITEDHEQQGHGVGNLHHDRGPWVIRRHGRQQRARGRAPCLVRRGGGISYSLKALSLDTLAFSMSRATSTIMSSCPPTILRRPSSTRIAQIGRAHV